MHGRLSYNSTDVGRRYGGSVCTGLGTCRTTSTSWWDRFNWTTRNKSPHSLPSTTFTPVRCLNSPHKSSTNCTRKS